MITPTVAQQQVRDHPSLSLLVVAPAGCGKTEALALRVAGLLEHDTVVRPRRILAITFTHRAKDNIRARLRTHVPVGVQRDRVTVANFHGLAARLIRAHGNVIGIHPDIEISESDWVREQCHRRHLDWPDINALERALRVVKLETRDDDEVAAALQDWGHAGAIEIEEQRLKESRATYDDMLRYAELILANDTVADLYRQHFGAVIVDEYQDLTPQQLRVINHIGRGKTTFAGDLAQGIYGFTGADPATIDVAIRNECDDVIEFAESHRSSPAVLAMVNSLIQLTGGTALECAKPDSWPQGGLAGAVEFATTDHEARWVRGFADFVLDAAPNQRIGIVSRAKNRLRFIGPIVEDSGHPVHRWEDGVLDPETARIIKATLPRIDINTLNDSGDKLAYLRDLAELEKLDDFDSRRALADSLNWVLDRLNDGYDSADIVGRIRVGDQTTLLNAPGIHLLSGHVGKGQQFDWVLAVGLEQGCLPDFRSTSPAELDEEARTLSVMLSRARHGVIVTHSLVVPTLGGYPKRRPVSEYWNYLFVADPEDFDGIDTWVDSASWDEIGAR